MEDQSMESRIQQAMRSRVQHFRDQADSLTFEGVRRLLEKDLALDTYALDVHKKFIKGLVEKYMSGTEDDNNESKGSEKIKPEEVKEEDEAKIEESPVIGLLSAKSETKDKIPTEDMIKEAIWKKATYFRSKSEELTVANVRRLLEEDLELKKFSLDPFKKLITKQLDEVLNSQNDTPNNKGSISDADSSHDESDNIEEFEVNPKKKLKKKSALKEMVKKSEMQKKRKKPAQETEQAKKKKKIKNTEKTSHEKNDVQDSESSDEKSDSSAGKSVKKEVVAPVYGKKVERLKSIIKACGMSVAPTVYKKAKQAPEEKREAFLVKELQEILSKEGLSTNPSEKEIKEVKRRKERAKELEGIDMSNIVVGSRRRSTFNFIAPPKPKEIIESDSDDSSDDEEDENGSEDGDTDNHEDGNDHEDGDDPEDNDTANATKSQEVPQETLDSD